MTRTLRHAAVGAGAGFVATLLMSAWMLVAQREGWLSQQPPEKITDESVHRATGARPSGSTLDLLTALVHLAIGCGAAALYGLAFTPRRLSAAAGAFAGALYGVLIWLTSYGKLLPELDLMPPPTDDRQRRPQAMIVAHVIYGGALGALVSVLRPE